MAYKTHGRMANQLTFTATKAKETKRTWKFDEDPPTYISGTIYVQKSELAKIGNPTEILVTIKAPRGK